MPEEEDCSVRTEQDIVICAIRKCLAQVINCCIVRIIGPVHIKREADDRFRSGLKSKRRVSCNHPRRELRFNFTQRSDLALLESPTSPR